MTLTEAKAFFGMIAGATPAGTNVGNNQAVGMALTPVSFANADIAYSFSVAGADTEVGTLTLSSGATADTTGTPTWTDDEADFEGIALPTAVRIFGVLVECTTAPATSITVAGTFGLAGTLYAADDRVQVAYPAGDTNMGTVNFTFSGANGVAEVTVLGKTS